MNYSIRPYYPQYEEKYSIPTMKLNTYDGLFGDTPLILESRSQGYPEDELIEGLNIVKFVMIIDHDDSDLKSITVPDTVKYAKLYVNGSFSLDFKGLKKLNIDLYNIKKRIKIYSNDEGLVIEADDYVAYIGLNLNIFEELEINYSREGSNDIERLIDLRSLFLKSLCLQYDMIDDLSMIPQDIERLTLKNRGRISDNIDRINDDIGTLESLTDVSICAHYLPERLYSPSLKCLSIDFLMIHEDIDVWSRIDERLFECITHMELSNMNIDDYDRYVMRFKNLESLSITGIYDPQHRYSEKSLNIQFDKLRYLRLDDSIAMRKISVKFTSIPKLKELFISYINRDTIDSIRSNMEQFKNIDTVRLGYYDERIIDTLGRYLDNVKHLELNGRLLYDPMISLYRIFKQIECLEIDYSEYMIKDIYKMTEMGNLKKLFIRDIDITEMI